MDDQTGCITAPALVFKNYSFRYRTQIDPTLIDINLTINKGEKILILGPSGSGKSTLVHCVNGIIPHAFSGEISGELYLMDKNINELDIFGISKIAGTVLQDTDGQFVGLNAAEDIAFAQENDCEPAARMRKRAFETAELVGMSSHLDKSPHDLSGGQKQRVSIAGVLVDDVEILLFDGPLANLDPAAGKETIELIDELHKSTGKTIIIVEHRLEDALYRPVDKIIVMDKGRIVSCVNAAELLSSDTLIKTGIREPLYINALKYAGIAIQPDMNPQHTKTLTCDYEQLKTWDSRIKIESADNSGEKPEDIALEARDVRFRYDDKGDEALKGISFKVQKGECIALVGRNGSGKSTLAKCICGFVNPDSGSIFFDGKDLSELSITQRAEKIGYVMQNPNQMISFPLIYEETAFGLKCRGFTETETKERVYESLKICGLYPFRNWPVNALSFGQKKRLTIASILVLRPSFIILDEPTAGQDYRHYTEFMEFLYKLNSDLKISLMLITHDMHLMLEYTTRALVLSEGERVADKKPYEVLTDDDIINKASLKRTSLYELALNARLDNPQVFVEKFIYYDRNQRMLKREKHD